MCCKVFFDQWQVVAIQSPFLEHRDVSDFLVTFQVTFANGHIWTSNICLRIRHASRGPPARAPLHVLRPTCPEAGQLTKQLFGSWQQLVDFGRGSRADGMRCQQLQMKATWIDIGGRIGGFCCMFGT